MTRALAPRPAPIRIFAGIFLALAILALLRGLTDLPAAVAAYAQQLPQMAWDTDRAIVMLSASFTIACIPVALVWFFASRFARWLVAIMVALRLTGMPVLMTGAVAMRPEALIGVVSTALSLIAVIMLFTPTASAWFQASRTSDAPLSQ